MISDELRDAVLAEARKGKAYPNRDRWLIRNSEWINYRRRLDRAARPWIYSQYQTTYRQRKAEAEGQSRYVSEDFFQFAPIPVMDDQSRKYYPPGTDLYYTDLTLAEECEKFRLMNSGDEAAREFLIRNHLLFAMNFAKRLAKGCLPENETASAANLAIMKALPKFNPDLGIRFNVLLRFYIKREISELWESTNPVDYKGKYPGRATGEEKPLNDDFEDAPNGEEEHLDFIKQALQKCEARLNEAERELVRRHYVEGVSLAELGQERGVTRAAVSKIHVQILKKLKDYLKKEGIESL